MRNKLISPLRRACGGHKPAIAEAAGQVQTWMSRRLPCHDHLKEVVASLSIVNTGAFFPKTDLCVCALTHIQHSLSPEIHHSLQVTSPLTQCSILKVAFRLIQSSVPRLALVGKWGGRRGSEPSVRSHTYVICSFASYLGCGCSENPHFQDQIPRILRDTKVILF